MKKRKELEALRINRQHYQNALDNHRRSIRNYKAEHSVIENAEVSVFALDMIVRLERECVKIEQMLTLLDSQIAELSQPTLFETFIAGFKDGFFGAKKAKS